jgi:hypothetical protein
VVRCGYSFSEGLDVGLVSSMGQIGQKIPWSECLCHAIKLINQHSRCWWFSQRGINAKCKAHSKNSEIHLYVSWYKRVEKNIVFFFFHLPSYFDAYAAVTVVDKRFSGNATENTCLKYDAALRDLKYISQTICRSLPSDGSHQCLSRLLESLNKSESCNSDSLVTLTKF